MSIRSLPDPDEHTSGPRDRCTDSGNVIQIVCPACAHVILLDPRRLERLRGSFVLRCERCAEPVEVRRHDATRPVPDDIAQLYATEPLETRPARWKWIVRPRH